MLKKVPVATKCILYALTAVLYVQCGNGLSDLDLEEFDLEKKEEAFMKRPWFCVHCTHFNSSYTAKCEQCNHSAASEEEESSALQKRLQEVLNLLKDDAVCMGQKSVVWMCEECLKTCDYGSEIIKFCGGSNGRVCTGWATNDLDRQRWILKCYVQDCIKHLRGEAKQEYIRDCIFKGAQRVLETFEKIRPRELSQQKPTETETCPICLEKNINAEQKDRFQAKCCKNWYHKTCISDWKSLCPGHPTCPTCRAYM